MTEEQRNVGILKGIYARWGETKGGSASELLDLMDDDVHWCSLGAGVPGQEFSAECKFKSEVPAYFEKLAADWELLGYDADEYVAQGDRVVMLGMCHWKHRGTGKEVHSPKADVVRFRDGKIVHFMEYYDTAQAIAATQP